MKPFTLKLFGLLAVAFTLTACEVDTPNGQIPTEYAAEAKKVMGDYRGYVGTGGRGTLSLRLTSDNRVVAKFSGALLGKNCGKIGTLRSVEGSGSGISAANFDLLNASCVEGRTLGLSLEGNTIRAQVLHSTSTYRDCPTPDEIEQCHESARKSEDRCEREHDAFKRDCRDSSRERYGNCSACVMKTENHYIYGEFRR